jgi:uncharacterized protein YdhG (YjbR/CyaY superfamily)
MSPASQLWQRVDAEVTCCLIEASSRSDAISGFGEAAAARLPSMRASNDLARRKPVVKDTEKFARSTTADDKPSRGFTAEERAAMKERAKELKAEAEKAEGEEAVLAKIAEMSESDRTMAEKIHAVIKASAPALSPKLWYGMPAYAKDGKVVCFFQPAQKFNSRYATFGFNDDANLDDGVMWPTAYALTELTAAEEARIGSLVKRAAS